MKEMETLKDTEKKYPVKITKGQNTYDLHVMWSIHNKCNYACTYCPEGLHSGEYNWLRLEDMEGFINKINNHYVKELGFRNILFSFTGGEPTLWPDFRNFLKYINGFGFRVGLTTNGSVSVNYWKQISTYFDYICLSFHPESADMDNFLKVFEYLHNEEKTVVPSVRVMMHTKDEFWQKSIALIERLKHFPNWTYECVHILEDYGLTSVKSDYGSKEKEAFIVENSFKYQFDDPKYTHVPEIAFNYEVENNVGEIEKLDENKLINEGLADFDGWSCFIGVEQLFIHATGLVKRAGCNVGPLLGNIMEYEKIQFPTEPIICDRKICFCPTDIRISKYAPGIKSEISFEVDPISLVGVVSDDHLYYNFRVVTDSRIFNEKGVHSEINETIDKIVIKKKIDKEKVLLSINVDDPLFSIENIVELGKALNKEKRPILAININILLELNKIQKILVLKTFDYVKVDCTNDFTFKNVVEWLGFSSQFTLTRVIVTVDWEKIKDKPLDEFNDIVASLYRYKSELHILNINGDESRIDPKILASVECRKVNNHLVMRNYSFETKELKALRQSSFVDDETVVSGTGEVFRRSTSNITMDNKYKGWSCSKGINNIYINNSKDIMSSQCDQADKLGILGRFVPDDLAPDVSICEQKNCVNETDCLLRKRK